MTLARAFRQESAFWPFLVALGLQLVAFAGEIRDYHPTGDDIALIVHATGYVERGQVLERLMRSYAGYFTVYPEWTSPFANFFRPLALGVYAVEYLLFQDYWGLYLVLGYLVNALAVAMVYVLSRLLLQSHRVTAYLVATVFFLTVAPSKAAFFPSFAFDPLAAVMAAGAFLAMAQSRLVLATVLVTAAVFVKETALVAPFALGAGYLVLVWTHREPGTSPRPLVRNAVAMMVFPVALWVVARVTLCNGFGGTYVTRHLDTGSGVLRKLLLGVSVWPLGHDLAPVAGALKRLVTSSGGVPGDGALLAFVVVNLLFAGVFAVAAVSGLVRHRGAALTPRAWAAATWVILVGVLVIGLGLEKRFGYLGYMFGIPLLGRLVESAHRRIVRLAATAYLVVQCFLGAGQVAHLLSDTARTARHAAYARARDLTHLLETVSLMTDRERTVYLVNDVVGDYAGPLLRRFATRDPAADLVVLSSRTAVTPRFVKHGGEVEITLNVPDPLVFPGADAARMLPLTEQGAGEGLTIRRNATLVYRFPEGKVHRSLLGDIPRIDFGRAVTIAVEDPRGVFVYYDADAGQHRTELPWTH